MAGCEWNRYVENSFSGLLMPWLRFGKSWLVRDGHEYPDATATINDRLGL